MSKSTECTQCNQKEHHDPQCPEMFFKNRDGTPDRSKPRGVVPPGALPPLGPLRTSGEGARRAKAWAPISKDRYISTAPRSEETEEAAYQAELFFGRRYGLTPNRVTRADGSLEQIESGDFLLTSPEGRRVVIDVKSTHYETGQLVSWLDARVKADVYVLVVGTDDLRIAGWAPGREHRTRTGDLGHGPRNVTPQELLRQDTDALMTRLGHPPQ